MSVWINGYTEAKVDGKWHCIDFHQYDIRGKLHHVPCVTGQSMVWQALEWDCDMQRIMGAPADLSEEVRRERTSDEGVLYGTGELSWFTWHVIEGNWFAKANLSLPEFCGFFPRQDVCRYLSNPDECDLDTEQMLSVEEYQALDPEVKKAYQYFEYTETGGSRQILRDLKQAVQDRVRAYNESLSWDDRDKEITLADVRVLITEE